MQDVKQRVIWLDVLRGIAITFVVLGHNPCTTDHPEVFNIIFSFHMPLFFFISGYLFDPHQMFRNQLRRRFNSLLKPYLFSVLLVSLFYLLVKGDRSLWWYLFWTLYGNGPNLPKLVLHLWFLPHLFLVTLFVWALFKYIGIVKDSSTAQLAAMVILLISGVMCLRLFWNIPLPASISNLFSSDINSFLLNGLLQNPAYAKSQLLDNKQFLLKGLPFCADILLVTAAFFISGYFVRKNNLEIIFHKHGIALPIVALFAILHYYYDLTIDLNLRRYDDIIITTLLAYAGIVVCTYSSNIIASANNTITTTIQYIGRYSLVIFIFHPMLQGRLYSGVIAVLPGSTYIAYLLVFAAGVGLPLLLNWLLLERIKLFRNWYYAK